MLRKGRGALPGCRRAGYNADEPRGEQSLCTQSGHQWRGNALLVEGGNWVLIHNTIGAATGLTGTALAVSGPPTVSLDLQNTIVANHATVVTQRGDAVVTEDHNLFDGATVPLSGTVQSGGSTIAAFAAFADPTIDDYTLRASSYALNLAADLDVDDDLAGGARPQGNGRDLGAYESPFDAKSDLVVTVLQSAPIPHQTHRPTLLAAPTGAEPITYQVTVRNNGPLAAQNIAITGTVPVSLTLRTPIQSSEGSLTPTVTGTETLIPLTVERLLPGEWVTMTLVADTPFATVDLTTTVVATTTNEGDPSTNVQAIPLTIWRMMDRAIGAPPPGGLTIPPTTTLVFTTGYPIDITSVTSRTILVQDSKGAQQPGDWTYTPELHALRFTPAQPFHWGATVQVSAGTGVRSDTNDPLTPLQWAFQIGADRRGSAGGCAATFAPVSASLPQWSFTAADWGDYDGDGDLDLILTGRSGSTGHSTRLYVNEGGTLIHDTTVNLPGVSDGAVAWGDIDNDGDLDLLLTGQSSGGVLARIYRNERGQFTDIGAGLVGIYLSSAAWGDFDNDGDLDLVVVGIPGAGAGTYLYRNEGIPHDGGGANGPHFTRLNVGLAPMREGGVAWGDYDNDGDLDLALVGYIYGTGGALIYRNDSPILGDPRFTEINAGLAGVWGGTVAWGDYDHDGDLDLLYNGRSQHTAIAPLTKLYRNDGGTFVNGPALPGFAVGSVAWGDYDNDGDLDILGSGNQDNVPRTRIYRNVGNGVTATGFVEQNPALAAVWFGAARWGDFDGDGALDILMNEVSGGAPFRIYRNLGCAEVQLTAQNVPTTVATGAVVQYVYQISHASPWPARNVRLVDTLPASATAVSCQASAPATCQVSNGQVTANYGTLTAGTSHLLTVTLTAPSNQPMLRNQISVASDNDGDGSNNTLTHEAPIAVADVALTAHVTPTVAAPGTPLTFTAILSNQGWIAATDVGVTITLPDGVNDAACVAPGATSCAVNGALVTVSYPILAAQRSTPVTLTVTTLDLEAMTFGAVVQATNDVNPSNNQQSVATTVVTAVDVGFAQFSGPTTIPAATPISYTVVVTNAGPYLGRDVRVAITVPAAAINVGCQISTGTCTRSGNAITAAFAPLAAGAPQTTTVTLRAPAVAGVFTTTAQLSAANDSTPLNNSILPLTLTVLPATDLALQLSAQPDPVLAGAALTYTLHLENLGPQPAALAVVTATLANVGNGLTCAVAPAGSCLRAGNALTITVADLQADGAVVATLVMTTPNISSIFTMTAGVAHVDDYQPANNRVAVYPSVLQFLPVQVISPAPQAHNVSPIAPLRIDFPFDLAVNTVTTQTLVIWGELGGRYPGTMHYDVLQRRLTITPTHPYLWGDVVHVTVGSGITSVANDPVAPYQTDFRVGSMQGNCSVHLTAGNSNLPVVDAAVGALGDYDGDGDLDLIITTGFNNGQPRTLLTRNDNGLFVVVPTALPNVQQGTAAWGDYDGDGDLDLLLSGNRSASGYLRMTALYRNEGNDQFSDVGLDLLALQDSAAAWGDYDNDGDLDFVIAGNAGSPDWESTRLYRNDGNDQFTLINANLLGATNGALAWGDYDNDGDLDLLVTGDINSSLTAGLQLYRNDQVLGGSAVFVPVNTVLPAMFNSTIRWGDYDGDGDLDLLMEGRLNVSTQTIRVLRNDGVADPAAPHFTPVATLASGFNTTADWGDYDNDGDLDVLTSIAGIERARVYRYLGESAASGADFAVDDLAPFPYLAAAINGASLWGDFDGNGTLDIWFSSRTTGGIHSNSGCAHLALTEPNLLTTLPAGAPVTHTVQVQNQGPQLATAVGVTLTLPTAARDLTCVDAGAGLCAVQGNRVSATYATLELQETQAMTVSFTSPPVTDRYAYRADAATGSGAWVVATPISATFAVRNGISVTAVSPLPQALAIAPTASVVMTFSQPLDLTSISSRTVTVVGELGGRYPGRFTYAAPQRRLTFTPERPFVWGDRVRVTVGPAVRGVAVGAPAPDQWQFTVGAATGQCPIAFTDSTQRLPALSRGDMARLVDYDSDGDLDLLMTGGDDGFQPHTYLYANQGGTFVEQATVGLPAVSYGNLAWGDYDGDGDPDLLLMGDTGAVDLTAIYRNDGPDTGDPTQWRFTELTSTLAVFTNGAAAWGDYDNDGDLDLLVSGYRSSGPRAMLYRNDRTPAGDHLFAAVTTAIIGGSYSDVEWGDYDNDGDLDLAILGSRPGNGNTRATTIYRNEGIGATDNTWTFTDIGAGLPGIDNGGLAWGDYDNDGDLDLAVNGQVYVGYTDRRSYLFRNENGTFTQAATFGGTQYGDMAWGDFDNDGDLDLLNQGAYLNGVQYGYLYRNNSSGGSTAFQQLNLGQPFAASSQIHWGDTDHDGALDLLLTGDVPSGSSLIYRNRGCADLTPTIAASPTPIQPGAPFTQTVTVENQGPQRADSVAATVTLPAHLGAGYCGATAPATCTLVPNDAAPHSVTWSQPLLAAGAQITLTLVMTAPTDRFALDSTVQVNALNENDSTDNGATLAAVVDIADVMLGAAVTPPLVTVGEPITYTLTVTNLGLQPISDLQLVQQLPLVEDLPSCNAPGAQSCLVAGALITMSYGTLPVGATVHVTLTVRAPDQPGSFANVAHLTATNDTFAANNGATPTVSITSNAALTLTQFSAPAWIGGELPLTYTVNVKNEGPHIARNVQIEEQLPVTMTASSCQLLTPGGSGATCVVNGHRAVATLPTLAVQEAVTMTVVTVAPRVGAIHSDVRVTAANAQPAAGAPTATAVTGVLPASDLALTAQAAPMQLLAGAPITYLFTVQNNGPLVASNGVLRATLPPGFTARNCTAEAATICQLIGDVVEVALAPLAEDAATTITLTMTTPDRTDLLTVNAWVEHPQDDVAANNEVTLNPQLIRYAHAQLLDPSSAVAAALSASAPPPWIAPDTALTIAFDQDLDTRTVTSRTLTIHGALGGQYLGEMRYSRATRRLTFTPDRPFIWGELIEIGVTRALLSTGRDPLQPAQWQLRVGEREAAQCDQYFTDVGAGLPAYTFADLTWADYDTDGDLDLLLMGQTNGQWRTELYTNELTGDAGAWVHNSAALFPGLTQGAAAWGDYDHDGDPDLLISGDLGGSNSQRAFTATMAMVPLPISMPGLSAPNRGTWPGAIMTMTATSISW
ncbi:MAG: FG-GAP-like repeat-containing protein [Caldilineaceae bacterium]